MSINEEKNSSNMGVARLASVTPPKFIGETSLTKIKQSHFYYYDIMCNLTICIKYSQKIP